MIILATTVAFYFKLRSRSKVENKEEKEWVLCFDAYPTPTPQSSSSSSSSSEEEKEEDPFIVLVDEVNEDDEDDEDDESSMPPPPVEHLNEHGIQILQDDFIDENDESYVHARMSQEDLQKLKAMGVLVDDSLIDEKKVKKAKNVKKVKKGKVCRYWRNKGFCRNFQNCPFAASHTAENLPSSYSSSSSSSSSSSYPPSFFSQQVITTCAFYQTHGNCPFGEDCMLKHTHMFPSVSK